MTDISIVIATHNRAALLKKCIASIKAQKTEFKWELIIVVNGCSDNSLGMAYHETTYMTNVKVIEEPVAGVARARNIGWKAAGGQLVAFIDDDAEAMPGWINNFVQAFIKQPHEVVKIVGEINPIFEVEKPDWFTPTVMLMISAWSGFQPQPQYVKKAVMEGNSCYRRAALEQVDGFNEVFGRTGESLLSCENVIDDLLLHCDFTFFYDPAIRINHFIFKNKCTFSWVMKRYFWQGITDYERMKFLKEKGVKFRDQYKPDLPSPQELKDIVVGNINDVDHQLKQISSLGFILRMIGVI